MSLVNCCAEEGLEPRKNAENEKTIYTNCGDFFFAFSAFFRG
jgi:hypothetical protein